MNDIRNYTRWKSLKKPRADPTTDFVQCKAFVYENRESAMGITKIVTAQTPSTDVLLIDVGLPREVRRTFVYNDPSLL
jgi:hypothetical protein